MPNLSSGLTERQSLFCHFIMAGCTPSQAAKRAGYRGPSATHAMRSQKVQIALRAAQAAELSGVMVPKALRALGRILDNPDAPAPAVVSAARLVFDATGLTKAEKPGSVAGSEVAEVAALDPEALERQLRATREQILQLRAVLNNEDRPGDSGVIIEGTASQLIDL